MPSAGYSFPIRSAAWPQAEAEAATLQAVTQIKITDLERRAIRRRLAEEAIKQKNIEDIAQRALLALQAGARPEDVENDWIANFFDKCRLISDEEMQELWARVLAGEANAPGKFSKRTVNLLASFDKADAELFRTLCSFVWSLGGRLTPLVFDCRRPIYVHAGIEFDSLRQLVAVGLISFDAGEGHNFESRVERLRAFYFDEGFVIEFPNAAGNSIGVGEVLLTKAGEQLASVSGAILSPGFRDYVLGLWRSQNVSIRSLEGAGADSGV